MTAPNAATTLRFQLGARTIMRARRRLHRVALSLDDVLEGRPPALPPLGDRDGHLVTSLPAALLPMLELGGRAMLVRQRYRRYWTDLTIGHAAWLAGLSGNARAGLKRKARRLAAAGRAEMRGYRTPDEIAAFHALARPLSALTYQERLLGSGLPADPAAMLRDAAADRARGWLLLLEGAPIAYLYGAAEGSALRYDHVGHDPAHGALSPGTLLHAHAFAELFAEHRFARFDFTEGEGQHKRQFATGGIDCVDVLLLRPTLANRALLALLGGWDRAMSAGKRLASHPRLSGSRIDCAADRVAAGASRGDISHMHLVADAIVLAVRAHGEHGVVARALTRDDGVQPGYVRGGRSRQFRPVLQPGNTVRAEWRARTAEQLPALTVELVRSLAPLHTEPLAAAAIEWVTALAAAALPEAQPYPRLHDGLSAMLDAIEAAPAARGWAPALVRFELLVLAQLGFGLDLSACVATGAADDLAWVSPKSGGAVSRGAGAGYERALLPLPAFLIGGEVGGGDDLIAGLRLTGHFLARDVLVDRRAEPLAARERLVDRLKRAIA